MFYGDFYLALPVRVPWRPVYVGSGSLARTPRQEDPGMFALGTLFLRQYDELVVLSDLDLESGTCMYLYYVLVLWKSL